MKLIKNCYYFISILCFWSIIKNFELGAFWEGILLCAVPLLFILYWIVEICIKEALLGFLDLFLDVCSEKLSVEKVKCFSQYLLKIPKLTSSISCFFDTIAQYSEKHLSPNDKKCFDEAFLLTLDHVSSKGLPKRGKTLRVNQLLNMKVDAIIKRFAVNVLYADNSEQNNRTDYLFALYIPSFLYLFISIIVPEFFSYKVLFISLVYIYLADYYLARKGLSSTFAMFGYWLCHFCYIVLSPEYLRSSFFLTAENFVFFHLNFIISIITGIQTTNRIWTKTIIEKNTGEFFSDNNLIKLIGMRLLARCRIPFLWFSFFLSILGTILAYSSIFEYHLKLGSTTYCALLSISIYFGGIQEVQESINGLYFTSETTFAFLLNTLYLANIVRLIHEPKLYKEE